MGEAGRKKRRAKTNTEKNSARSRHLRRARRRRARMRRRILTGVLILAVAVLVITAAVLAIRNTRKRKAEEEAAKALSTDVADMPFSSGIAETAATAQGPDTVSAVDAATATAATDTPVHVGGIDAFALYRYDETSGIRVKCATHESVWTRGEDIVSLEAFASDSENIVLSAGGGQAWYDVWRSYWQQASGAETCRIGYDISFDLKNGEHIHAVLLKPGDELPYREYLENYLYDDAANANAGWYSHLEPDDLSENMLLTSIKFTPGERFAEIADKITVSGFVYDALEDFDYDGNYIGDLSFTTEILNR